MRKFVILSLCAFAFASPALADQLGGKVGIVDRSGKTFSLGTTWMSKTSTYKTTPQTVYMMGATPVGFEAVKIGTPVQVDYHKVGSTAVADRVTIE